MRMIYISIAMIIFISQTAFSQLDTVYSRHDYIYHPKDTAISDGNKDSPTYNKHLVKRLYIDFDFDLFDNFPSHSLQNIDSISAQFINQKSILQRFYVELSSYQIKYDTMNYVETLNYFVYYLEFNNFVDYDTLVSIMSADTSWSFHTWIPNYYLASLPEDIGMKSRTHISNIIDPNILPLNIPYDYHNMGWYWNYFRTKLPLAWEITYGDPKIVICMNDEFSDFPTITHKDLGNFKRLNKKNDGAKEYTSYLGDDHGLWTTSTVNATRFKNTDESNKKFECPAVGYAPDCISIGFDDGGPMADKETEFTDIDADGISNNSKKILNVTNHSWASTDPMLYQYLPYSNIALNAGIIFVAAAGNAMKDFGQTINNTYYPKSPTPARLIHKFSDGTLAKVICVGATENGNRYFCSNYGEKWYEGWNKEAFVANYNFSESFNKFPNPSLPMATQDTQRNLAFMDIVAPVEFITAIVEQDKINKNLYYETYDYDTRGTSQAAPQVTGTVALMESVWDRLGETDYKVHQKAYDILTFTADKIPDGNAWWPGDATIKYTDKKNPDGTDVQTLYVTQVYDNLKRSWAQRMGFGRLNAYRAVAHSIANKGEYEYSTSQVLATQVGNGNESPEYAGQTPTKFSLIHFGSKVKEGTGYFEIDPITRGPSNTNDGILNVLQWGGSSIPNEVQINELDQSVAISHNNQGVTKIK